MVRFRSGLAAGALLLIVGLVHPTASADPTPGVGSAEAGTAAGFLERELVRLDYVFPSTTPGTPDSGLLADTLIGLHAADRHGEAFSQGVRSLREMYYNGRITVSGGVAKRLMVAVRAGVDPTDWGVDSEGVPIDLPARLSATLDVDGRYRNLNVGEYDPRRDLSNTFSQSLALMAMQEHADQARLTLDQQPSIDYLVRQQCPSGGFRNAPPVADVGSTCSETDDALVSVDNTAMAVWALAEVGGDQAALDRGVRWLRERQHSGGGFGFDSSSPQLIEQTLNANSTGLAALALTSAGAAEPAGRAGGWLSSVQLPPDVAPGDMAGAVSYSTQDYLDVLEDGPLYWSRAGNQDRLRRSTSQALLGLSATPPTDPPPPPAPEPPPTDPPRESEPPEPGEPGVPGVPGAPGRPGAPGEPGAPGQPGLPGLPGHAGSPGYAGTNGLDGESAEETAEETEQATGESDRSELSWFGGQTPQPSTEDHASAATNPPGPAAALIAFLRTPAGSATAIGAALLLAAASYLLIGRLGRRAKV
ncbi:hypothetical protein [Actinoalloteichus hymeniacidonis]|uniref:Collagen triple helix repeat protein n=1 Tax=Actinoalloteichus hymeniacidonis TaxID=340345 RepID=A0AAC9HQ43_9PSEU|nr:hypothetical protein [Actinoalloteichus hymeniacidonis]AOS63502.1 collagen triple helix repeat protein [Actinoalloteichus hymeniacidonis]MBB5908454.1 hypothetical protein [Actinoalloteichus hymeniacidonis]